MSSGSSEPGMDGAKATSVYDQDGPQDADSIQPRKWRPCKKRIHIIIVGYCEFLTFLVSMMLAPGVPQVLEELDKSTNYSHLGSFSVTVYILGFCVGPLILTPISDKIGRRRIYMLYSISFVCFTVACGQAWSLGSLIAFRFVAGCFGGAPMSLGGAVVADMYAPGARDIPMAWYSVGTLMGPTIGPILGGIITGSLGWRWVFRVAATLSFLATILIFTALRETHLPTLQKRRNIGRTDFQSSEKLPRLRVLVMDSGAVMKLIGRSMMTPFQLASHVEVGLILLLIGVFNGLVNMILSSLGSIFQSQYNFQVTYAGLTYIGIGIGGFAGLLTTKKLKTLLNGVFNRGLRNGDPRGAFFIMAASLLLTAAGFLWFGWAAETTAHWIVPILGLLLFGFGYIATRLSTQIFLIDLCAVGEQSAFAHGKTASALAAHTAASSIGGAILPLSTLPLFDAIGLGWGGTVMALITMCLCIIPIFLFRRLRERAVTLELR